MRSESDCFYIGSCRCRYLKRECSSSRNVFSIIYFCADSTQRVQMGWDELWLEGERISTEVVLVCFKFIGVRIRNVMTKQNV